MTKTSGDYNDVLTYIPTNEDGYWWGLENPDKLNFDESDGINQANCVKFVLARLTNENSIKSIAPGNPGPHLQTAFFK